MTVGTSIQATFRCPIAEATAKGVSIVELKHKALETSLRSGEKGTKKYLGGGP